jgi:predicted AAA+ superfamily ATPase
MSIKDNFISQLSTTKQFSSIIYLIGPRASGKLTYLTMLSYYNLGLADSTISIELANYESKELRQKAKNICLQGQQLEATTVKQDAYSYKD